MYDILKRLQSSPCLLLSFPLIIFPYHPAHQNRPTTVRQQQPRSLGGRSVNHKIRVCLVRSLPPSPAIRLLLRDAYDVLSCPPSVMVLLFTSFSGTWI